MWLKTNWYKLLSVLIILYVLIFGILTPLKTGISSIEKDSFKSGTSIDFVVNGYNSHYMSSRYYQVWLKFDNKHVVKGLVLNRISEQEMQIGFDIPQDLPFESGYGFATLVQFSPKDGPSILPSKLYFEETPFDSTQTYANWSDERIQIRKHEKGFKFPYRNILNETIRNTFFHVAIWFAMFFLMILSMIQSILYLKKKDIIHDIKAYSFAQVAIIFGFVGLATGSMWAKYTWGTYWTSDVKLNMTAIAILIYCAYWVLRGSIKDIDSKARISAAYNIFAFLMLIPLIFVIPRMTDSLHPGNGGNPALGGEDLDNTLRAIFYPAIIGYSMLGYWISTLFIRLGIVAEEES